MASTEGKAYTGALVMALGIALVGAAAFLALREPAPQVPPEAMASGAAEASEPGSEAAAQRGPATTLGLEDVRELLGGLPAAQRSELLADPERFSAAVHGELARRALGAAARSAGFDRRPEVVALLRRAEQRIVADAYLAVLARQRLAPGFPDPQTVREFYERNRERFRVAERVELWQVFLPVASGADPGREAAVRERAEELVGRLRRGELAFAEAAARYSAHRASRQRGGYMGLTPLAGLRPELREEVRRLAPGAISDPVRGPQGFHVLRRGPIVAPGEVPFEEARPTIESSLRQAALAEARQQVIDAALGEHGPALSDEALEAWRRELVAESAREAGSPSPADPAAKN